ncbi:MAG TPA: DUF5329 family protein [Pseudoduganella sp.]|jgi:hypothetical protein
MKRTLMTMLFSLACGVAAAAPAPAPVRAEIDALLSRLQASGCQFNRNGTWHSAAEARTHLLRKLDYLEGKGKVQSAEQFIALGASGSSSSGKAYQVKCGSGAAVDSAAWLGGELAAIRAAKRR